LVIPALVQVPPDAAAMPNHTPTPEKKQRALETEVILAVIGLYIFIAGVLLLIHFLQPSDRETRTSSPSPSHAERFGELPRNPAP
jgi:hypothetical protein